LVANRKFAAEHANRQRIVNALHMTQFRQRITIRCRTHNSAANANSLKTTQFRQRMLIHCSWHSFDNESKFRHNTQFGSKC
jgi:hypothetical protein